MDQKRLIPPEARDVQNHDYREIVLILTGPKKELVVSITQQQFFTIMNDYIENHTDKPNKPLPKETTILYLLAIKSALEEALKRTTDFKWNFAPTDPKNKMANWFNASSQPEQAYAFRTEILENEIEEELNKINMALGTVGEYRGLVGTIRTDDYLTLSESHNLTSGQVLYFDATRQGKNLAEQYGASVEFIEYKEKPQNPSAWPLIYVNTKNGEKIISAYRLRPAKKA